MKSSDRLITDINLQRFEAAFLSGDDVGAVIRCEFEVEQAAHRALRTIFPKYDKFAHRYLSDHLKTFRAFGCEGPIFQVADYIKKVRNEFAHKGVEAITDIHIKELSSQAGTAFGGRHVRDWTLRQNTWGIEQDTKWSDLPNRQQFVLVAALDAASLDTIPQRIPKVIRLDHLPRF